MTAKQRAQNLQRWMIDQWGKEQDVCGIGIWDQITLELQDVEDKTRQQTLREVLERVDEYARTIYLAGQLRQSILIMMEKKNDD